MLLKVKMNATQVPNYYVLGGGVDEAVPMVVYLVWR
jgi:hypothetical protein